MAASTALSLLCKLAAGSDLGWIALSLLVVRFVAVGSSSSVLLPLSSLTVVSVAVSTTWLSGSEVAVGSTSDLVGLSLSIVGSVSVGAVVPGVLSLVFVASVASASESTPLAWFGIVVVALGLLSTGFSSTAVVTDAGVFVAVSSFPSLWASFDVSISTTGLLVSTLLSSGLTIVGSVLGVTSAFSSLDDVVTGASPASFLGVWSSCSGVISSSSKDSSLRSFGVLVTLNVFVTVLPTWSTACRVMILRPSVNW